MAEIKFTEAELKSIQDISQNYVSNGGQPLNFSQYYNIDFPMYGPSAMRNVVANNQISLS